MNYEDLREAVEKALPLQLARLGTIPEPLNKAMLYSLTAGGKRLRPVLLLASCELLGVDRQIAMPYACALEMIHTYSLIHDDLPAMDNDDLRRGKPTNHKVFGEDVAILAGDGLLNAAYELMLKSAVETQSLAGLKAGEIIARRAGVTGMVAGQSLDVTEEGTAPTLEKVSYIHAHKTADLLTAPMEAGFALAEATEAQMKAAAAYGYHLGIAFQMVDDLLDLNGDPTKLGKNVGMDAAMGKLTWPSCVGVEKTCADAAEHVQAAVDALNGISGAACREWARRYEPVGRPTKGRYCRRGLRSC